MKKYILGSIRKIIFESNSGPYKVGLFRVKDTNYSDYEEYIGKVIGFTGSFTDINKELDYVLYGEMVEHPKYGLQFSCESYELKEPSDEESLVLYLSSGMFKGIGLKTAKNIVSTFKDKTIDIIKNDYDKLLIVSGMNVKKATELHNKIVDSTTNQDLIIELNSYGFSVKEAIDLITIYGNTLPKVIENNIYDLTEYVSFDKVDSIFLKYNKEDHPNRIEALIKHNIYNMCYENGDTLIHIDELFLRMKKCFSTNFTSSTFLSYISKLIEQETIFKISDYIMLDSFYYAETSILRNIKVINSIKNSIKDKKLNDLILDYQKDYKINFDIEQIEAIKGSIENNLYIITGGPGTGKTTIIKAVVNLLKKQEHILDKDIALLAPTGRSAKRMSESVGMYASTIHKFLKWNRESETFQVNEFSKASEKIIIVDEASMIDIFLFDSLLKGIHLNCKLILIGDENQLPSIGPGDVLYDLLRMDGIKSKCLTKIYRAKKGSYINTLAKDIKDKKVFDKFDNYDDFKFINSSDEDIMSYVNEISKQIIKKKISIDNYQILAPMYKGINGIDNLNNLMAELFNGESAKYQIGDKYYRVNDKVIQLVNDIDNNIFNGDIGYIKDISYVDKKLTVTIDFMGNKVIYNQGEFDRFSLAYAISIHKAQGSEYDNVVIVLAKSFKRMFYNKLIYTAVTRAKKSLILIGDINSLNSSVQTMYAEKRNTYSKLTNN